MESPDIQAKYQKLAAEYSKLRAQNQVLKKAVVDEQGKTSELVEHVKTRDQSLRKAEQENDSLTFRNQHLTKRLTLLQEDLDEIQSKSKKGKGKNESVVDGSIADTEVFTEELQSKIQENARLQSELAEIETTYRKRMSDIEGQLENEKRELQKYKEKLQVKERSGNDKVEQLENERVKQEVVAQQREGQLRALKEQVLSLQEQLKSSASTTNPIPSAQLTTSTPSQPQPQTRSLPLHINSSSSSLSIPMQNGRDRSSGVTARSVINSFDVLIQKLSENFAKFLCSYSTRVSLCHKETEVQQKLIDHLKSASTPWHSLSSSYHQLTENVSRETSITLENLTGLSLVSQHVTACGTSLRKALPLVVHWVCEGNGGEVSGCRAGAAWSAAYSRLVSSWGSLAPYVATLASQSVPGSALPSSAQGRIIAMLGDRLANFHAALKEAAASYEKKASDENSSGDIKATNDDILSLLTTLATVTGKISGVFKDEVVGLWNKGGSTPSTPSSPYTSAHAGKSSVTPVECTVYEGGRASPCDSTPGDTEASLLKQLALSSSKISQLEAEREHWRLEHQLLQCKHQKEAKRVRHLEKQLKGETASLDSEVEHGHTKDHSGSTASTTSVVGEVEGCEGASDEREKDIRNYFTSRCSHLYMQLTSTTSQATLYQNECEALMRRLAVTAENQSSSEQEVDNQREKVNQLKETLQTTSRNYEEQISTMSEHLADLNEKLTEQRDVIEQLKYEMKNRKSKK